MDHARQRGATLAELLITVVVLAVTAAVVLPNLSLNDSSRLDVASEKTVNALRFARSEAQRSGQNVIVDTETAPGRWRLLRGGCPLNSATEAVIDPLTRRPFDVDIAGDSSSRGVVATAKFLVGGVTGASPVFDSSGAVSQACSLLSGVLPLGTLTDNSVVLAHSGKSITLRIDASTGRVSGF